MTQELPVEYRYGPGFLRYLIGFVLLLLAEALLVAVGWGLVSDGYWASFAILRPVARVLAWIGLPGVILTGMGVAFTARFQMRLVLTEDRLICPRFNRLGMTRQTREVPYSQIVGIEGGIALRIHLAGESRISIAPGMMESPMAFADFRRRLEELVERSRDGTAG